MIKPITYEDIIKKLRNVVMTNTKLPGTKVLNALSVRGTDLSDVISSTKTYSFSLDDVFILFELLKDQDGDNYVTPKDDDNMIAIASYTYHLMIYGNGSDLCSQVLRTTFKQPKVAMDLREEGIYVRTVNSGETINEFINNTLLLRNDLEVKIEVAYVLENATKTQYFRHEDLHEDDIVLTIDEV